MARLHHAPRRCNVRPRRTTPPACFGAVLLAALLVPGFGLAADGDAWTPVEGVTFNKDGTVKAGFATLGLLDRSGPERSAHDEAGPDATRRDPF